MRRLALLAEIAIVLALVVGFWILLPNSLFYRNRRPTRVGRITNRVAALLSARGAIPAQLTLEVPGRRTGRTCSTALFPVLHNGRRYLVSMLGDRAEWVRNVRAAGGRVALRHGSRECVLLVDVPVEERAPVLKAYLRRAIGARPHFGVDRRAAVEEFARIAVRYPVFRIVPEPRAGVALPQPSER